MQILLYILLVVAAAIVAILIIGSFITFLVGRSPYQAMFVRGHVPDPAPEGFHKGLPHVLFDKKTPWLGKSFDRDTQTGFNIFTPTGASILKVATPFYSRFRLNPEGNTDAYHFKTYTGKGKKDAETDVIKLDYDSAENPWLIRIILDEIVETAPRAYLGKIHVKLLPGFYVTIGYFGLRG
ncbi:MAG: hypothetical protein L0229_07750 [Blastocatellia bacterium]|nr:hypothetical protein [Blastocatellia bacterium]